MIRLRRPPHVVAVATILVISLAGAAPVVIAQPFTADMAPAGGGIGSSDAFPLPYRTLDGPDCFCTAIPSLNAAPPLFGLLNDTTRASFFTKDDGTVVLEDNITDITGQPGDGDNFMHEDFQLLYDHRAGRWLTSSVLDIASPGEISHNITFYISDTPDPSGGWDGLRFNPTNGYYPFPISNTLRLAQWNNAYIKSYVAEDTPEPGPMRGPALFEVVAAHFRPSVLDGLPFTRTLVLLPLPEGDTNLLRPATFEPVAPPPPNVPPLFVRVRDDEVPAPAGGNPTADVIEVWELQVDWSMPAGATLVLVATLSIGEIDTVLDPIAQPSGDLAVPDRAPIDTPRYRPFGGHESIVGTLPVRAEPTAADRSALYWYELRRPTGGTWTLHHDGVWVSDDTSSRFGGSVALDPYGNMLLAGIALGPDDLPSTRYIGRTPDDPLGTLPSGEMTVNDGPGELRETGTARAASKVTIDAKDGCSFWVLGIAYDLTLILPGRNRLAGIRDTPCIPLYGDGFESGDTSAWSATLPGL